MAAEDYTGASPAKRRRHGAAVPVLLHDALAANGVAFDVYDVDAHGRTAPDNLGVLEPLRRRRLVHGRRRRDARARLGPRQRVAAGDAGAARGARLRQRGRARALHGPARRAAVHAGARHAAVRPVREPPVQRRSRRSQARCLALSGSGNSQGDPIEYLFGAAITTAGGGHRSRRPATRSTSSGIDDPLAGLTWGFNGADSAQNQAIELVVHRDRRLPARSPTRRTASRSSRAGRRPSTRAASRVRSTRTPGSRSCGPIAPTRRTSA